MKLKTPWIFLIFMLIGHSSCINLNCENKRESILGQSLNICHGQNDLNIIDPNTEISKIDEKVLTAKSANHITGLSLENKTTQYLPSNLGGKFKNLMALRVKNGRLKELIQEDLKSLTKLKYLNLDDNDITSLKDDVFEFNENIELIWFSKNKISSIGLTVFNNLKSLGSLDFTSNQCISRRASFARSIPIFLQLIKQNCSNLLSTTISNGQGQFVDYTNVEYGDIVDQTTTTTTTRSILNRGNHQQPENVDLCTLAISKAEEELRQSQNNFKKPENELNSLNGATKPRSRIFSNSYTNLELEQTKHENSMLSDDLRLLKAQLDQQKRSENHNKVRYGSEIKDLKKQLMEKDQAIKKLELELKTCKNTYANHVTTSTERVVISNADLDYY